MTTARELAAQRAQNAQGPPREKANDATEAADAAPLALLELLAAKDEIRSVKQRAYMELKKFSRSLIGIMLLSDDLGEAASIDEAMVAVRYEHSKLIDERNALAAEIASLQAAAKNLSGQKADLAQQVDQLNDRVGELDRERRQLEPTVESYRAIEAAIAASQQRLAELQAEEARLKPIVRAHHDVERKLPEAQERLGDIERKLAAIRQSI
jgi:chromosome segregation ATPase